VKGAITYSPLFQSARAFAVMAPIWGGLAFAGLMLVVCAACSGRLETRLTWFSGLYLLAAVCQGLSLLLLNSNLCSSAYLEQYIKDYYAGNYTGNVPVATTDGVAASGWVWVSMVSCGSSRGVRMAIAGVVLYCTCMALALRARAVTITESLQWHQDLGVGGGDDDRPFVAENGQPPAGENGGSSISVRKNGS
jgi:hypothetical protein